MKSEGGLLITIKRPNINYQGFDGKDIWPDIGTSKIFLKDGLASVDQNYATSFWIYGLGLIYDTDGKYYLEDASGNTRFTANSSGSRSTTANYDPFGNIRSSSGILPDSLFNQQLLDSGSNMYFLRARYYDPEIGRFISRDPVKGELNNPQTHNPYSYSLNNPVNLSDPSGEYGQWIQLGQQFVNFCSRLLPRSTTVLRGTQNPIVKRAAETGREMHKLQQYPVGYEKEVYLRSGTRVDALNESLKHII